MGLAGCQFLGIDDGSSGDDGVTPVPTPATTGATGAQADTAGGGQTSTGSETPDTGPTVVEKLAPPERVDGAHFGTAVDIDGDRALVGASRDVIDEDVAGAAYVFHRAGGSWRHEDTLVHPRADDWDAFGRSVALNDSFALVGAPGVSHGGANSSGAAYAFRREARDWTPGVQLLPNDGQGERFGTAVELERTTAVVASLPTSRIDAPLIGSAYVFGRTNEGWQQRARLQPAAGGQRNVFGSAIATADGRILAGAPWTRTEDGTRTGAVFQFVGAGADWSRAGVVTPAAGSPGGAFGESIALRQSTAVVGSPGLVHPNGARAGAVTILDRDAGGWRPRTTLLPPDGEDGDRFARAIGFEDDWLVVGSPNHDTSSGARTGVAYVFRQSGENWRLHDRVRMPSGNADARFGRAVAVDRDRALVGAIGDLDVEDKRVGSAVLIDLAPGP